MAQSLIDAEIFASLQAKIDEESEVRDKLRDLVQNIEKQIRTSQALLSRAHSTPSSHLAATLFEVDQVLEQQILSIADLAAIANLYPYYKYNSAWSRQIQDLITIILIKHWLRTTELLTIDQVGRVLNVPVNLKDRDEFHITIEEYLHALISMIDELARLAVNSVTLGDYGRPLEISNFIKDVHAGFQLLNLKNDSLRRRSDSIKYSVKKVEDVVYDLSLRNLIPKKDESKGHMEVS